MAQIHALLLVSPEPLTTEDIMDQLHISRGNANMNIRALISWGIIQKRNVLGERKEYFEAEKDMMLLARQVSKERQKREIEPILRILKEVEEVNGTNEEVKEFKKMTGEIYQFSKKMNGVIDKFANSDTNWFTKVLVKILS
ncbi:UNVERIFIED_CONTAM: hypothetical protein GTU68_001267 [Idotea baltica]|nr:hypothetical protein [Idotea baltica]